MGEEVLDVPEAGVNGGGVELCALADGAGCAGEFATEGASDELSDILDREFGFGEQVAQFCQCALMKRKE